MSLGRLLAAGRSLIGLRNGESRYRENKQVRLPKFISPKNPFATVEGNIEPIVAEETSKPLVPVAPVVEKPATLKVQPAPSSVRRAKWLGGMRWKLNPFGSRGSAAKPTQDGVANAARQGELALERVQVLRNDLSDAECNVGQAPPKMILPALPVMTATMEKLEPVSAAWNRLAAKFIGTDQT